MSGPTRMQGIALGIGVSTPWFRDKRSLSQMGERVSHRGVRHLHALDFLSIQPLRGVDGVSIEGEDERNADNGISQSQKRTQRRASLLARRMPTQVK